MLLLMHERFYSLAYNAEIKNRHGLAHYQCRPLQKVMFSANRLSKVLYLVQEKRKTARPVHDLGCSFLYGLVHKISTLPIQMLHYSEFV